jgi:hypothetical protein
MLGFPRSAGSAHFQPTLRSVTFCSCYIYSPCGGAYASKASRLVCTRLKSGDSAWLAHYAGVVYQQAVRNPMFSGLLAKEAILVPVPGSSPPINGVWAAQRLAKALYGIGLGGSLWTGVQRRFPVRKSATALNGDRPDVQQHYESFAVTTGWSVTGAPIPPARIIIVDDVITKGRTILATAMRLHQAFPNADIRAFALVRTMGFVPDVSHPLEPCHGVVRWAGGDARREP